MWRSRTVQRDHVCRGLPPRSVAGCIGSLRMHAGKCGRPRSLRPAGNRRCILRPRGNGRPRRVRVSPVHRRRIARRHFWRLPPEVEPFDRSSGGVRRRSEADSDARPRDVRCPRRHLPSRLSLGGFCLRATADLPCRQYRGRYRVPVRGDRRRTRESTARRRRCLGSARRRPGSRPGDSGALPSPVAPARRICPSARHRCPRRGARCGCRTGSGPHPRSRGRTWGAACASDHETPIWRSGGCGRQFGRADARGLAGAGWGGKHHRRGGAGELPRERSMRRQGVRARPSKRNIVRIRGQGC
jgi:hypothetical protein